MARQNQPELAEGDQRVLRKPGLARALIVLYGWVMKLRQGQVWKLEEQFIRIVLLERLAVEYKVMKNLETRVGVRYRVTKKQFCALIKAALLVETEKAAVPPST